MSLNYLIAGDFGQTVDLTFIDVDTNLAADISDYSQTIQMIFTNVRSGDETAKTAIFKTDGSDGIISYTVESGLLTAGLWHVRGRVSSPTATLSTEIHEFMVLP